MLILNSSARPPYNGAENFHQLLCGYLISCHRFDIFFVQRGTYKGLMVFLTFCMCVSKSCSYSHVQVRISVSELLFLTVTANILTTSELKSVDCFNRVLRDNIPLCWSVSQSIGRLVGGSVGWSVVPFSAAASKGLMTYASMLSHIRGIFSFSFFSFSFSSVPPSNPSLEAQIPVLRPKSRP